MNNRTCSECPSPHWARGYCRKHYRKHRSSGQLQTKTLEERFWEKVDKSGDCWEWTAHICRRGYGLFGAEKTMKCAHRVSWELIIGPIPEGMEIDHLCFVTHCVNPGHMRLVTRKQNMEHQQGARSDSSTGVRGVSWSKQRQRYCAQVTHHGKNHNVGRFKTLEEAEAAVRAKRAEFFTHDDAIY